MDGTRLKNKARVYDLFYRLANAAATKRGTFHMLPYTGAGTLRAFAVDTIAYPGFGKRLRKNQTHKLNGSRVTVWYDAAHKATQEQIDKAKYATEVLKIPRKRYTGALVDVFVHNGTLYALLAGVLERDRESNRHNMNFRMLNLDDGNLKHAYVEEQAPRKKKTGPKKKKKAVKKKVTRGKAAKVTARKRRAVKKKKSGVRRKI